MRIYSSIILILAVIFYYVVNMEVHEVEELPYSEPTAVELFMELVAQIESGGNYQVVNTIGMMGKYQFSPTTVRSLGFNVTREEFLNNPELQDSVMVAYMRTNDAQLSELIERYEGTVRGNVTITRAGILAAAHFAGTHGARRYLLSNQVHGPKDIYGKSINMYMSHFSDFKLPALTTS
jgi:hypothetical protein